MAKFEKLRISLQREEPGPILENVQHRESFRSREEFLREAFSLERPFLRGASVRLLFSPLEMPDGYVGGFFKRERPAVLSKKDLSTYQAEHFESALAVVQTTKEQVAWVQVNSKIGSTRILLESYLSFLLENTEVNDWKPYIRYMDAEQEYWNVIKRRKREIARVSFTFIPPNSLGADDRIYDLVKEIQLEAHPDTQQHVYRAAPGQMEPESPLMEASAKIAMEGGGEAEVRDVGGKRLYKSGQARITEEVPDDDLPTPEQPSFVRRAIARLFDQ